MSFDRRGGGAGSPAAVVLVEVDARVAVGEAGGASGLERETAFEVTGSAGVSEAATSASSKPYLTEGARVIVDAAGLSGPNVVLLRGSLPSGVLLLSVAAGLSAGLSVKAFFSDVASAGAGLRVPALTAAESSDFAAGVVGATLAAAGEDPYMLS